MNKTHFSTLFTIINAAGVAFTSQMVISVGDNSLSHLVATVECIPLYLISLIAILIFFLYKPKTCSLFVLPRAYVWLIPLYLFVIFVTREISFFNLENLSFFFWTKIIPFYIIPLVAITFGMVFYLDLKKSGKKAQAGSMPFLLRIGEYTPQRKRKILIIALTVMAVLQGILFLTAIVW